MDCSKVQPGDRVFLIEDNNYYGGTVLEISITEVSGEKIKIFKTDGIVQAHLCEAEVDLIINKEALH